ncbi:MAG: hypothetical protein RIC29_06695 [Rhodospirillaceae bacterium]
MTSESDNKKSNANPNPNQGEGNREAARDYNERQKKFIESGKVDDAAKKAKKAVESAEKQDLKDAENKGKRPAAGR